MCENLESIVIPNTIQHIEANAFYGCNSLKQIVFKGTRNQWNQIVSYGDYLKERCQDIIIFAPESELSDFLNNISANLDRELKNK